VVESEDDLNVIGLVTERDVLPPDEADLGIAVSRVMNNKPLTTTPGTMMGDVAKIMVRNRIRRLPVISEGGIAGIVTVFDVLGYLEEGEYKGVFAEENLSTRVEEIMESNVITVKSDDDLGQVIKLVKDIGYGGFPVTEGEKLTGIITTTDMLAWIYRQG
jgi:CBS domain-containing protein